MDGQYNCVKPKRIVPAIKYQHIRDGQILGGESFDEVLEEHVEQQIQEGEGEDGKSEAVT